MSKHHSDVQPAFATLIELLSQRAGLSPEKEAYAFLIDGEEEGPHLTYGDLDLQARAIAAFLQQRVERGSRALLIYPSGLEFICAFFGCLYAGIVAVPTYPPQTRTKRSLAKLQAMVNSVQPSVTLTCSSLFLTVESLFVQAPELRKSHVITTDVIETTLAEQWLKPGVDGNTLAFLQYTSGSISMPKGVMLTHGNLLHNLALIHHYFEHTSDSRGLIWLPPYHDMGFIGGILQPLYYGGLSTLMSPVAFLQRPIRWLQAISRTKATTSGGPNFAYDLCVRKITPEQKATLDLSSWDVAFNGAEPIRPETLQRFVEAFGPCGFRRETFYPCYGLAEATLMVSGGRKAAIPVVRTFRKEELEHHRGVTAFRQNESTRTLVGCGQTLSGQKIVIVNPETFTACLANHVGEIWVSGASIAAGYWQQSEETQRTFQAYLSDTGEGPFLRTGDLGFVDDGEIFVTGRLKDLIIIRGRNHYPQDIELTVEACHAALRPGCCAAFSLDVWGEERLVIVQEVERQYRHLDVDEVVGAIRQAVAEQHDLQVYTVALVKTGSIPKTSSGKLQHGVCAQRFVARTLDILGEWTLPLEESVRQNVPRGDTCNGSAACQKTSGRADAIQAWLVSQISAQLHVDPATIDVREALFHYGLDSIKAVNLAADLEAWLDCHLPPTLAYDYPTVEALAQYLAQLPLPLELSSHGSNKVNKAHEAGLQISQELLFEHQTIAKLPAIAGSHRPFQTARGNTLIESIGVYLPPRVVSTREIVQQCINEIRFPLEQVTGIQSRRMAGESEYSFDLAKKAVAACLAHSKYRPEHIDLLICCNISRCDGPNFRFSFEPSTSIRMKQAFDFSNALAFDLSNACTGMFTAMGIVDTFLKSGLIRCGMVVSGEYISHLTQTAQKEIDGYMDARLACLTVGDAGAAMILEQSPGKKVGFHAIEMYTLGRYHDYCIARATEQKHGGAIMFTDTVKLAALGIQQGVAHSALLLERLRWPIEAVQKIVMHQTSQMTLTSAAHELNSFYGEEVCHEGKVISNLAERGNTATTTHVVALMDHIYSDNIKSGDNVLFGISGSGLTIGTALYTFDDLPERLRQMELGQQRPRKLQAGWEKAMPPIPQMPRVRVESIGTLSEGCPVEKATLELASAAAEHCLATSSYTRRDIDLLIYTGVYRDDFICEPAIAAMIAGKLKINDTIESQQDKKTFAFDIVNGATGFLNACYVAIGMIRTKKATCAMVSTSEIENNAEVLPTELLGIRETGSAIILDESADSKTGFGSFVFRSFTHYIEAFASYTVHERGRTCLRIEKGRDLENYYLDCIHDAVHELLSIEKLDLADIKVVLAPQISAPFIDALRNHLQLGGEQVVNLAHDGKDLFTSSIPYTLHYVREHNMVKRGDIGLLISAGAGIQVSCATYYF